MEWKYKNVTITVTEATGKFKFSVNGVVRLTNSLDSAKDIIDSILKDYYTFNKQDIDNLCKKLNKREAEFVTEMIEEIKHHTDNAYCEMGTSSMWFIID